MRFSSSSSFGGITATWTFRLAKSNRSSISHILATVSFGRVYQIPNGMPGSPRYVPGGLVSGIVSDIACQRAGCRALQVLWLGASRKILEWPAITHTFLLTLCVGQGSMLWTFGQTAPNGRPEEVTMQMAVHITPESELDQKAKELMQVAYEYWLQVQKLSPGAVIWLTADNGHTLFFTRGEFGERIKEMVLGEWNPGVEGFWQPGEKFFGQEGPQ
jgi:hypothetical protein